MKQVLVLLIVGSLLSCGAKHEQEKSLSPDAKSVVWQMPDTATYARVGKTKLSDYGFFKGKLANLEPTDRVFPYDINTPLFTDYALKKRFIYLPEGTEITYNEEDVLEFPVGAVLIKNFYYSHEQLEAGTGKILETRLLIHEESGWKALPYLWDPEQTEAYLEITGRQMSVKLASGIGVAYAVPNMQQCKSCHDIGGKIVPIGPSARQLNKVHEEGIENQLAQLVAMGWLKEAPAQDQWPLLVNWEDGSASLKDRARAYLEINCAHCHRKDGPAKNSGLDLTRNAAASTMGVFKAPVAAGKGSGGLKYDIVPGKPDKSILIYRMESNDPAIMMPELGRSIVHKEGVELIKEWVRGME
ncbi:hypothetical protein C900_00325 [Fulvivirga imtechensis AK7]|uniref:Uncharacterized protein n=1 Tax=Fulvivirga imtechensis AK7 TaxID=1237149 RepID=L8JHZ5_9BACT|nr:SO2930 family diheme c-type cytochrome [Fulvivirga imtechensis]ELR68491.1 hypothetical protein C900_00325 [Fulvivirga imtechensis AK7]